MCRYTFRRQRACCAGYRRRGCRYVPADVVAAEQGRLDRALRVDRAQRAQPGRPVGGQGAAAAGPGGSPRRGRATPAGRLDQPLPGRGRRQRRRRPGRRRTRGWARWRAVDHRSRPAGGAWLLDGLWQQLGIGTALREVLGGRRFGTDLEQMAFALVANRALAPASKLAAAEWITRDAAVPGLAEASDDQAYRAMDLLIEADTDARVQEAVFFAVANLLTLEVDLLFFDTTSTYFERDTEDPPSCAAIGEQTEAGFRRYGPFRALQRASAHTRVVAPASPPPRDTGSWCSRSNGPRALPRYQQVTAGSVSGSPSGRGS